MLFPGDSIRAVKEHPSWKALRLESLKTLQRLLQSPCIRIQGWSKRLRGTRCVCVCVVLFSCSKAEPDQKGGLGPGDIK